MISRFLSGVHVAMEDCSPWLRYAAAIFAVAWATVVRVAFFFHGGASLPYISFYPVVFFAALFLGMGPGLFTVGLSALIADLSIEPVGSLYISSPVQIAGMVVFIVVGLLVVWICEAQRRAGHRANQAENALRDVYQKATTTLLDSISDGFMALDRDWRFVSANLAAAELVHMPLEDLLGKVIWDVFPDADRLIFGKQYRLAMNENVPVKFEDFYPEPLNAWFEVRCYPSTQGLNLFFTDITDRKATEGRLRQLSRAVEQSPALIIITDTKGRIEYVNPKFTSVTGYSFEEVIGKNPRILKSGEYSRETYKNLWETIRAGREWRGEFHNKKKNGELFWEAASICPITDENGAITHFLAVKEDITERKAAQTALVEAKHSAEEANRSKDEFIATLSHELRTPLTPILMTASALELDEALDADLRGQISLIRHNVELEARLIDDLLDVTKISHGKFSVRAECIRVDDILGRALAIVRSDLVVKNVTVEVDASAEAMTVNADPARLQQVFWNILKNALKFTPSGGCVRIRSFNPDPKSLSIEVSDNGIGIAPEFLDEIFRPFQQGEATGKHRYGGLGLGLAISKAIIEVHGGSITAKSAGRNCGASFTIKLPLFDSDCAPETKAPVAAQTTGPLRILLVEDHDYTRAVLFRLLTREGHHVEVAGTCAAALAAMHCQPTSQPYQVLLSDLGLPDGSGLDLVKELLAISPALKAIALSGYGTDSDINKSMEAGFARHLTKPISFQDLRRMLTE